MRAFSPAKSLSLIVTGILLLTPGVPASGASIPVSTLTPLTEVGVDQIALATGSRSIALVGSAIELRDLKGENSLIVREASTTSLFLDVIKSGANFIAVGIAESSTVSARMLDSSAINPDSITVKPQEQMVLGMTRLQFLEFDESGAVIRETFYDSAYPILPRSILKSGEKILVVGDLATERGFQGFLLMTDPEFTSFKISSFGAVSTSIFAAANPTTLYGSSDESIASSPRRGIRDGVIIYLDKNGRANQVVRSFAAGASRNWVDVNTSHLAVGNVITGNKSEVAITDFDSRGKPEWTMRIPGRDPVIYGRTIGLIVKSRVAGLTSFAPKSSQGLFISFDKKGVMTKASSIAAIEILDIDSGFALVKVKSGINQLVPLAS
jgi:hypothetical protein